MDKAVKEITSPSGVVYTIREQDGNDDQVLSNIGVSNEVELMDEFIGNIIQKASNFENWPGKNGAKNLPVRDKYTILIKSRMFSISEELVFNYKPSAEYPEEEYTEDLSRYVLEDYSVYDPKKHPLVIPPYKSDPFIPIEITLPGSRKVRFNALTSAGEGYLLKLPNDMQHINQELVARNLSVFQDNEWMPVLNFSVFTARDMAVIRKTVREYDSQMEIVTEVKNPITGELEKIPIFSLTDFFFPSLL